MNTETDTAKNDETDHKNRPENPWMRLLYLFLFAMIFNLAGMVLFVVVIIQFISKVATGQANERLRLFGHSLGAYASEIIEFMTYYNERMPFPFRSWPGSTSAPRE